MLQWKQNSACRNNWIKYILWHTLLALKLFAYLFSNLHRFVMDLCHWCKMQYSWRHRGTDFQKSSGPDFQVRSSQNWGNIFRRLLVPFRHWNKGYIFKSAWQPSLLHFGHTFKRPNILSTYENLATCFSA